MSSSPSPQEETKPSASQEASQEEPKQEPKQEPVSEPNEPQEEVKTGDPKNEPEAEPKNEPEAEPKIEPEAPATKKVSKFSPIQIGKLYLFQTTKDPNDFSRVYSHEEGEQLYRYGRLAVFFRKGGMEDGELLARTSLEIVDKFFGMGPPIDPKACIGKKLYQYRLKPGHMTGDVGDGSCIQSSRHMATVIAVVEEEVLCRVEPWVLDDPDFQEKGEWMKPSFPLAMNYEPFFLPPTIKGHTLNLQDITSQRYSFPSTRYTLPTPHYVSEEETGYEPFDPKTMKPIRTILFMGHVFPFYGEKVLLPRGFTYPKIQ